MQLITIYINYIFTLISEYSIREIECNLLRRKRFRFEFVRSSELAASLLMNENYFNNKEKKLGGEKEKEETLYFVKRRSFVAFYEKIQLVVSVLLFGDTDVDN